MSLCLDPKEQAATMVRRWGTAWQARESAEMIRDHHPKGSPQWGFWDRVVRAIRRSRRARRLEAA